MQTEQSPPVMSKTPDHLDFALAFVETRDERVERAAHDAETLLKALQFGAQGARVRTRRCHLVDELLERLDREAQALDFRADGLQEGN